MNSLKRFFKYFFSTLIYTGISLLVTAAIILSLARLALPIVENYKSELEIWIGDLIGQQVEIATLDAVWYGTEPQLVLKGVQLLSKDRMRVYGYFQDARLGLNLLASVVERKLVPGALTLEGARFGIIRHEDGHISIQGVVTESTAENESSDFLEAWLFQQRLLDVKNSELVWVDQKNNQSPKLFTDVNLRLINKEDRHLIKGSVELPKQLGSNINIIVDAKGDLLSANNWAGKSYIEVNDLHINELITSEFVDNIYVNDGVVTGELWLNWDNGLLTSSRGQLGVGNLLFISPSGRSREIDHVKTNYFISKKEDRWELALNDLMINFDKKLWPVNEAYFKYDIGSKQLSGEIDYLKLGDMLSLAYIVDDLDEELVKKIKLSDIHGDLAKLKLRTYGDEIFLSGEFAKLSNKPVEKLPGIEMLSGQFSATRNSVEIQLPKQDLAFSYSTVFKNTSDLKDVSADLLFSKQEGSWDFAVTGVEAKFKKSSAYGSLLLSARQEYSSPLLDLAFFIKGGSLADAGAYIPSNKMQDTAVNWIEKSLQKGDVQYAAITHFGEVRQYPFLNNEGGFDVNITVKNGALVFAPDWPVIKKVDGLFYLNSKSFRFLGNSGESIGNKLSNVEVNLPQFFTTDHYLFINGTIKGASENKLRYLHESPLENLFAKHIEPLKLTGESEVDLVLAIPLGHAKDTVVNGELKLSDNQFFAEDWKVDLKNVNTSIEFSEKHIATSLITGKIFDTPINGNIETVTHEGTGQLLIQGVGIFDNKTIGDALEFYIDKKVWANYISGNSEILASLRVPFRISNDRNDRVSLQLSSSLKNMAVDLPVPLLKKAGEAKRFQLFTELTGDKRDVNISYDNNFVLLQMQATQKTLLLEKGGIGFQQAPTLPQERGVRFSGTLPKFYWSEWEGIIFPEPDVEPLFTKNGSSTSLFFDVKVNDLEIFGKRFNDVSLFASQTAQNWSLNFTGDKLQGNVNIPMVFNNAAVVVDLDKLFVTDEIELGDKKDLSPSDLPRINLSVKDFRFKEMDFGKINLTTEKIDNGQKIEAFSLTSPAATINGNGEWTRNVEGIHKSVFNANADANNLGRLLDAWGFKDLIKGGKGKIIANIKWADTPANFDIKAVAGVLKLDLKDASLLDFDLGAAKLFSVLLPRRLLLDFRDVIQQGMYFDSINGTYKLENGDAFTNSLQLHGPVADIELAGKVGISSKTFDKVVTVNRRIVGDSLPLVGTVVMTNPVIGGGIFVMKKLFEKQIDDILSVQYTIEGSWAAPVITPVGKPTVEEQENVDSLFE